MVDADVLVEHPSGVIAALAGAIVYMGTAEDAARVVRRARNVMRVDASGCTILPITLPLAVGGPLDVVIVKGDDPQRIRMEIRGGKLVRWEQPG